MLFSPLLCFAFKLNNYTGIFISLLSFSIPFTPSCSPHKTRIAGIRSSRRHSFSSSSSALSCSHHLTRPKHWVWGRG